MTRFNRQEGLCPPDKLAAERIIVVGAGAVGRQVCLSLAAIGAKHITIFDYDDVDLSNIATQGYTKQDVGLKKVVCVAEQMKRSDYEDDASFDIVEKPWSPKAAAQLNPTIIFACADNMATRKSIWLFSKKTPTVKLMIDGRMQGTNLRMLVAKKGDKHYAGTLFKDEEAHVGRCTQRSTYYCATTLANLMVNEFAKFLKTGRNVQDCIFNMISYEMEVVEE